MKKNDLAGKRFGKLVAIKSTYNQEKKITLWECKCDCGNVCHVRANRLLHGRTKSCGCLRGEVNRQKNTTHGMSETQLYNKWHSMKARCLNKNNHNYSHYGMRGITVCYEWLQSFESFFDWAVSSGYKEDLTLDRIDNNGNYCPENCRWVTTSVQNNNRNVSLNITYNGNTKNLSEWCRELNLPYIRVYQRIIKYGYSFEEAITLPPHAMSGKRKKGDENGRIFIEG